MSFIFMSKRSRIAPNIWKFACVAKVDGTKVAEADVSAMLIGEEQK